MPSNTLAYLRIDLDPSASQKVNAFRLLRRVPEFESSTGITSDTEDLRELMFDTMVEGTDCDLSYGDDVEPWIGDRAGLGMVAVDDRVVSVAAIQVSDEQAAEDAVAAIEECGIGASAFDSGAIAGEVDIAAGGAGPLMGSMVTESTAVAAEGDNVAFVGDYMLIVDDAEALPDIVDAAESDPLSENDQFKSDMDALDGEGIASFWFDVDGLREEASSMEGFEGAELATDQVHSTFGAIRAGSDHIEYVTQATTDVDISTDIGNPIVDLPDTTLMALSASGGARLVDEYWPNVQGMIESFGGPSAYTEMLAEAEAETGLRLPDDLRTILGDNVTLSMDSTGLTPENIESEDPRNFYFGARLTTDEAAIQDVVDRINGALTAEGQPSLISEDSEGGLVVASNEDYARMLAEGGDLGSADGFDTAVPDASESSVAFYVDLDRISEAMAADDASSEDLETIEPMRSVGASMTQVDGGQRMTMRLVFD